MAFDAIKIGKLTEIGHFSNMFELETSGKYNMIYYYWKTMYFLNYLSMIWDELLINHNVLFYDEKK